MKQAKRTSSRSVRNRRKVAVKNIPQSVKYQRVTQSVAATGRFKPLHFVLMAVVVVVVSQLIKTLVYTIFFPGNESPSGNTFLLVVYAQYVLLAVVFILLVIALIQALRNLIREW